MKILTVFGTRPEAIKMAPVIKEMLKHPDAMECKVCVSAQHRAMLDPFLRLFGITADHDLNIMREDQTLEHITSSVLMQMGQVIAKERPDLVLVQGDTTTSMAAALAAFYARVRIGHIEAGLRTGDRSQPFPEEINRKIVDDLSDLYFVHTPQAKENLTREGVPSSQIELTGNTVIDALLDIAARPDNAVYPGLEGVNLDGRRLILVTAHRRENLGTPLEDICKALVRIASAYRKDVAIVFPVHLNPRVQQTVAQHLHGQDNIFCIGPLGYQAFVHLMKRSYLILTDSGGLQEEAPSLHKPVLVLRNVTERPEALAAGATRLVGTDPERIFKETARLLDDHTAYEAMGKVPNPYGDGQASRRIVERLLKEAPRRV